MESEKLISQIEHHMISYFQVVTLMKKNMRKLPLC